MDSIVFEKRKSNDIIDLVKLVLSFAVVALHANLFDPYLYPWLRLAVPLFFMISSYFFFDKIKGCRSTKERFCVLGDFALRNLKLYAFWFVVLFPINFFGRGWFEGGFFSGILNIVTNFFIGSTFVASWFISALVIGTAIIFLLSRKLNNCLLLIIGALVFAVVAMRSSYVFVINDFKGLVSVIKSYERIMNSPVNSFPASIFWIVLGKVFADGFRIKIKPSAILALLSSALLFVEWILIKNHTGKFENDFYFMLAPVCVALFSILLQLKPRKIKYAKEMRKLSIIIFASHGAVLSCVLYGGKLLSISLPSPVTFLLTAGASVCIGVVILLLERYKYLRFLKYSH